jgi:hypothetical protein
MDFPANTRFDIACPTIIVPFLQIYVILLDI